MTPEQTLDWLAQQHFDQCREDRPVQYWIRKMKSELPEQEPMAQDEAPASPKDAALKLALEALEQLDGIDTETECVTIDVGDVMNTIKEALAQPARTYAVVSGDDVPERMKRWVSLHNIQASEFIAFHIGFCCGEDSVQPEQEPTCPKCKNNRQVWTNQITGIKTCHRVGCTWAQPLQSGYRLVPLVPTDAMQVFVHKQAWINAVNAAPLPVQEPAAGKGKEYSEQLKLCARNVAFVSAGRVDMSSAAMQEMFALIDHVCAGIDSPPQPVQEPPIDRLKCGVSRAEWHDKAWELYQIKAFDDCMLPKNVSVHTLRAVFNATYDALVTVSHMKEPQPAQEVAAFIAAEERKREKRYGYFPKLHPSEYMDEPAQRTWVGLTDEEKLDLLSDAKGMGGRICGDGQLFSLLEEHEAKLKEKNT